ncbi:beta-ketoacyl-ACP synthase III [Thalassolituus hydrocarboniclasticus]|uniref:Beta-ketoacyl-ACP synthase III n=1 Tax=Thalassolituus hydrocarboniclasticus TaxID=2742796 RepID=A0ABY6ACM5_9GAMM|nr:beta-ketoacyl-ACP synthase III [Thalassolituus hydrocarboniclasticus]UXD88402.1 beta-ketoacyl-ACP synthase III [Thalassolituus hydrocarboniclasticus]
MSDIVISGSGLFIPPFTITNDELVEAYNTYANRFNEEHADAIASGETEALPLSSSEFIEKASGIKARYAMYKDGIVNPDIMHPVFPMTQEGATPEMVTMGVAAAREAMEQAGKTADDIDMIIVSSTFRQRDYPGMSVEIQRELGVKGFAYDMGIACSSATFGLINAYTALKAGTAKCVLFINPEFTTPGLDFRDRDSHFIFGDVATAAILEPEETATSKHAFRILSTRQFTQYSDNIRCDASYADHCFENVPDNRYAFKQQGRKVFKELLPLVTNFIESELADNKVEASALKRMWLHQANINMNLFAVKKLLGRLPEGDEAPVVLDEFANTASSGSVIAFHRYKDDFKTGDKGLICSFGAGYSIGSLLVEKL